MLSLSSSQNTCAAHGGETNCVLCTGCLEKEGVREQKAPEQKATPHGRWSRSEGGGARGCAVRRAFNGELTTY